MGFPAIPDTAEGQATEEETKNGVMYMSHDGLSTCYQACYHYFLAAIPPTWAEAISASWGVKRTEWSPSRSNNEEEMEDTSDWNEKPRWQTDPYCPVWQKRMAAWAQTMKLNHLVTTRLGRPLAYGRTGSVVRCGAGAPDGMWHIDFRSILSVITLVFNILHNSAHDAEGNLLEPDKRPYVVLTTCERRGHCELYIEHPHVPPRTWG